MSSAPHWLHDEPADEAASRARSISILGVIAWIAAIAVLADLLFVAQRYWG
jgi:hypothetical protein